MNITQESTGKLTATIKIELTKEDYQDDVQKVLKEYQRKAEVPGFRKGKVPYGMINKMYGKTVQAEEMNKKVSDTLNRYIAENKMDIIGYPLPNTEKNKEIDLDKQDVFEFFFDIGLNPRFELELDNTIKVNYYTIEVKQEFIDNYLIKLRKRAGKEIHPDTIEETDTIFGTFVQLDSKGGEVEGGIQNSEEIAIKDIQLKSEKKKFIGLKTGDSIIFNPMQATKSAAVTASILGLSEKEAEKFKGDVKLTIDKIIRTELAEFNTDFYKSVYPNDTIENRTQLEEKIKKEAQDSFTEESNRQFVNDAIEKIMESVKIPIPDDFLKRWILEHNQGKIDSEQLELQYDLYAKSMKWQLIEGKLIPKYNLEVKDEDIRGHVRGVFAKILPDKKENKQQEEEYVKILADSFLKNEEQAKQIREKIYKDKLFEVFNANLKKINKKVSHEEFIKLVMQTK